MSGFSGQVFCTDDNHPIFFHLFIVPQFPTKPWNSTTELPEPFMFNRGKIFVPNNLGSVFTRVLERLEHWLQLWVTLGEWTPRLSRAGSLRATYRVVSR